MAARVKDELARLACIGGGLAAAPLDGRGILRGYDVETVKDVAVLLGAFDGTVTGKFCSHFTKTPDEALRAALIVDLIKKLGDEVTAACSFNEAVGFKWRDIMAAGRMPRNVAIWDRMERWWSAGHENGADDIHTDRRGPPGTSLRLRPCAKGSRSRRSHVPTTIHPFRRFRDLLATPT